MNTLLLDHFDQLISTPEDVERLNQSILDLAVRGKLTYRETSDEPATDLRKRIKEEKAKLGKFKPLPAIKQDEIPFDLPDGWVWARLDDLVQKVGAGSTPTGGKQVYTDDGIKFIRSQNVWNDGLRLNDVAFIPESINEKMSFSVVKPKDILLNITGASIARSALVPDDFDIANVNQHVTIIRLVEPEIRKFIHLCIISPYVYNLIMSVQVGVSREGLSMEKLKRFLLPLPPLAEQQRIVTRVEELFAQTRLLAEQLSHSRTELDRLNESAWAHLLASETSEEFNERWRFIAEHFDLLTSAPEHVAPLRQSILDLAVRGKLTRREAGDEPAKELLERIRDEKAKQGYKEKFSAIKESEEPFTLPDKWEWARFGDITINRDGERIPVSKEIRENRRGGYDYYGASGVIDKIDEYLFDKSLLLIGEDGANLINRSTPIAFIAHGKYWVNNHAHVLDAIDFRILKYLEVFINAIDLKTYITGTAQPKMNQAKMNSIVVALPPLAEQERIVKRVEQLLGWCDALEAQLRSAEEERGRLVESVLARVI